MFSRRFETEPTHGGTSLRGFSLAFFVGSRGVPSCVESVMKRLQEWVYRKLHPEEFVTMEDDDLDRLMRKAEFAMKYFRWEVDEPLWVGGPRSMFKVRFRKPIQ